MVHKRNRVLNSSVNVDHSLLANDSFRYYFSRASPCSPRRKAARLSLTCCILLALASTICLTYNSTSSRYSSGSSPGEPEKVPLNSGILAMGRWSVLVLRLYWIVGDGKGVVLMFSVSAAKPWVNRSKSCCLIRTISETAGSTVLISMSSWSGCRMAPRSVSRADRVRCSRNLPDLS